MRVAVLADTHGLLREEVRRELEGCDRIIHAGDIGKEAVWHALEAIAPTFAIRGNVDQEEWAAKLPEHLTLVWEGVSVYVLHDLAALSINPAKEGIQLVISGHSHKARLEEIGGVIFLNPGSVGPTRFRLPVTMAWLHLERGSAIRIEQVRLLT